MTWHKWVVVWGAVLISSIACDADNSALPNEDTEDSVELDTGGVNDEGVPFPGEVWPTATPEEADMDPEMLDAAVETADSSNSGCLVVIRQGRVVTEWYGGGWDENTQGNLYSVTKSLTGLVVGQAVKEGRLDIHIPVSDFVPTWAEDDRDSIEIRHLLSMTSGLEWSLLGDFVQLANQTDMTGYATSLQTAVAPEEDWQYSNDSVQVLDAVLPELLETSVADWAKTHLFSPVGAETRFSNDEAGNTILYSEARSSCLDLARIGYLVLQGGKWGNEQLVDPDYLAKSLRPSSELNVAYGYLWWLNNDGHYEKTPGIDDEHAEGDGKMWSAAPEHIWIAKGLMAQMIVVDKENDLVFTRVGKDADPASSILAGEDWSKEAFMDELMTNIYSAL